MARQAKKEQPKKEVDKAETVETPKVTKPKEKKVVSGARIAAKKDVSVWALEKAVLKKDHGADKKGTEIERHPNTIQMLRDKGIV